MKKTDAPLIVLTLGVAVFAAVACIAGFIPGFGGPPDERTFISLRGEEIVLAGSGLYRNDSVSFANQAHAQDLVTLVVAVPFLLTSFLFASRGSLRAGLLLAGTFAYFAYTYATYAFGVYYNAFFLVYVAVLSMSLAGLILSLFRLESERIKARFSGKIVRRVAVGFDFFAGAMLLLMWSARILSGLLGGPDATLIEHYTTLPIQVMDLAFVVPLAFVAGATLAADKAIGYLLTGLFLLKGLTLGLAVAAMIVWMSAAGQAINPAETAILAVIIGSGLGLSVLYIRAIRSE